MKRKIALKRLSASDLTLFESHFRNTSGTKQKAFNLDRVVLIDEFFPMLKNSHSAVPVDVKIFGPALAPLHPLARKILKQQKNWRLDGEYIPDPDEESGRYDVLRKNDYALIEFVGETMPTGVVIHLIDSDSEENKEVYNALSRLAEGRLSQHRGMLVIEEDELTQLLADVKLPEGHVLDDFLNADELEDVVQNGIAGQRSLQKRRRRRGVTREELQRALEKLDQIGRLGEDLLDAHFEDQQHSSDIKAYVWEADRNAIAPYDFQVQELSGKWRSIDAKSTTGGFGNRLHVSMAELLEMAHGANPYDIYRLYEVTDSKAKVRVVSGLREFAGKIIETLEKLPEGITSDSLSINPGILDFGEEFIIQFK